MRWKDEPVRMALRPLSALLAERPDVPPFPGDDAPVVILDLAAREAAWRHVAASRVERGGLLVGDAFTRDDDASAIAAVVVRLAVPSEEDTADAISLRMEARVWNRARESMRGGERVVGWFHSHPGIGAFFSGTDRRTQAAFFAQPYSLGWVIDPIRAEEVWFLGAEARDVVKSNVFVQEGSP